MQMKSIRVLREAERSVAATGWPADRDRFMIALINYGALILKRARDSGHWNKTLKNQAESA